MSTTNDTHIADQATTISERTREVSGIKKLLNRPDFGAMSGVALVFIFFILIAGDSGMFAADGILNWSTVTAQLGVLALGACFLAWSSLFQAFTGAGLYGAAS